MRNNFVFKYYLFCESLSYLSWNITVIFFSILTNLFYLDDTFSNIKAHSPSFDIFGDIWNYNSFGCLASSSNNWESSS